MAYNSKNLPLIKLTMRHLDAPYLFLPGTHCDERIWMPLWQQLSFSQSNRCYVPLQWANDLEQMLSLTFDRINRYAQPVHLVGFSMGGYVASLAALQSRNVASLTLIGYNPIGLTKQEQQQRLVIIKTINSNRYSNMTKARLAQFLTPKELENAAITKVILDMSNDLGAATLKAHIAATTPRKDLTHKLSNVKIPMHFIAADQDTIADADRIQTFSESIPHCRYTCLNSTAHMMLLTQPEAIANLL